MNRLIHVTFCDSDSQLLFKTRMNNLSVIAEKEVPEPAEIPVVTALKAMDESTGTNDSGVSTGTTSDLQIGKDSVLIETLNKCPIIQFTALNTARKESTFMAAEGGKRDNCNISSIMADPNRITTFSEDGKIGIRTMSCLKTVFRIQ